MQQLTDQGQRLVNEIAQRHGLSTDAVTHMLFAVLNGNGNMAQFNHPELGGGGQWMRGGMIMVGDMFNNGLKARVDYLCTELSDLLAAQPGLLRHGSFQSQHQSGGGQQSQSGGSGIGRGESSLFVPGTGPNDWWPRDLGPASATGAQNNVRYAYFAGTRRLAVDVGGHVWVYDTLEHQIGGFSQQQGVGGSITFTSQYGTVNLADLPVLSRDGVPVVHQPAPPPASAAFEHPNAASHEQRPDPANGAGHGGDVFAAIERLGDLKAKGILTDEEFAAKKTELLARL